MGGGGGVCARAWVERRERERLGGGVVGRGWCVWGGRSDGGRREERGVGEVFFFFWEGMGRWGGVGGKEEGRGRERGEGSFFLSFFLGGFVFWSGVSFFFVFFWVVKVRLIVDNDTTVHAVDNGTTVPAVHTQTGAFSP